jgi:hypothetical protein
MNTSDSTGIAIDATGLNLVAATSQGHAHADWPLARPARFDAATAQAARTPERLRFAVYSLEVTMRSSVI